MRDTSSSEHRASRRRRLATCLVAIGLLAASVSALAVDRVEQKNGRVVEGRLLTVDRDSVIVSTSGGRVRIPRSEVSSIAFGEVGRGPAPLKVEIRNIRSDDAIDVFLDDEPVIKGARDGGAWVDLTDKLKTGNHALRLRIHNARNFWAYELSLRVNGVAHPLECGIPLRQPCDCCGKTGNEQGIIEDLPLVWIHVDRELGTAEVLP